MKARPDASGYNSGVRTGIGFGVCNLPLGHYSYNTKKMTMMMMIRREFGATWLLVGDTIGKDTI